jgi:hypothetical protein
LLVHRLQFVDLLGPGWMAGLRQKPPVEWTKPQTSSETVETFLPASEALRAIEIEVLGNSNVGHLGSRHT